MTEWTNNTEAKTATAAVLGGVLTVRRREDGKLAGAWVGQGRVQVANPEPGAPAEEQSTITVNIPLHDVATVVDAQEAAEARLRESLEKTHPLAFADAIEAEAFAKSQTPQPF